MTTANVTANVTDTDARIDADIAALDAHHAAITPLHIAAFRAPAVPTYAIGDTVWLWDYYSTATVVGQNTNGNYLVRSADCEGIDSTLSYQARQLRPASSPRVFIWPSKR